MRVSMCTTEGFGHYYFLNVCMHLKVCVVAQLPENKCVGV